MQTNTDITIWNYYRIDRYTEAYRATQVTGAYPGDYGASWSDWRGVRATNSGTTPADEIHIRIPMRANTQGREYVESKNYLDAEQHVKNPDTFTIDSKSYIAMGLHDTDDPTQVDEVFQVMHASDRRDRRSTDYAKHLKATAK